MGFRATAAKGPATNNAVGGGTAGALTNVPTWIKFSVTHTQLQAAALDNNIELYSLPARGVISGAILKTTTLFAGVGILTYRLSLGLVGDLERYMSLFDVTTAVSNTNFKSSGPFQDAQNWGAVTSIRVRGLITGANLSASTQGGADIWLELSQPLA